MVVVVVWGGGSGVQQRQQWWHVLSPREDLKAGSVLIRVCSYERYATGKMSSIAEFVVMLSVCFLNGPFLRNDR